MVESRRREQPVSKALRPEVEDEGVRKAGEKMDDASNGTSAADWVEEGTVGTSESRLNGVELPEDPPSTPTISAESPNIPNELKVNIGQDRPKSSSSTSSAQDRGSMRSTSSKFASLRAAFEQGPSSGTTPDTTKRRLASSEKSLDRFSERKQEYEVEIARLKDDLEQEKDLRVAFEEKVTGLEEEIDELHSQIEEREGEYNRSMMQLKTEAEAQLNAMASEARSRGQDADNLQRQLADLKRSVSASTRTSPQVSDTTIRQEIDVLQHEIQNWVVNNFRRMKIEASPNEICDKLEKVAEAKQLDCLRPIYQTFSQSAKLPIYQATVTCYVMEIFDEPFLFGLQGERDWARRLKQAAEGLQLTLDAGTYNRWRSSTFDALRQSESIKEPLEKATTGIAEMICITLQAITEVEESEARFSSLKSIVHRAISLAHLIRVQQAQYQFVLPHANERFNAISMEDISDIEGEVERTVRCATFPAIAKLTDEDGDQLDAMNVVVKARVLCNDSET